MTPRRWIVIVFRCAVLAVVIGLALMVRHEQVLRGRAIALVQAFVRMRDPLEPGDRQRTALRAAEAAALSVLAGDPDGQAEVLRSLARWASDRSLFEDAERLQREAIGALAKTHGASAVPALQVRYELVHTLDMRGRYREAGALLDATDQAAAAYLRDASAFTLQARLVRAGHFIALEDPDNALHWYREAEMLRRQVAGSDPMYLFWTYSGMAWCYLRTHHSSEALRLTQTLQDNPAYTWDRVGLYDWVRFRVQYALALRNTALDAAQPAQAASTQSLEATQNLSSAQQILLDLSRQIDDVAGPKSYMNGPLLYFLGSVYQAQGDWASAHSSYQKAYDLMYEVVGARERITLEMSSALVIVEFLGACNHVTEAVIEHLRLARDALLKKAGSDSPATQMAAFYLAAALLQMKHTAEAAEIAKDLDAAKLAAQDSRDGWESRLATLRSHIPMGTQLTLKDL